MLKNYFIRSFDAYYTYGSQATKYIESFGIESGRIVTGTNTVDTEFYKNVTDSSSENDGILRFLYVGQLIERKGLKNTIEAFSKISQVNWKMTIVGSGTDEALLKEQVKRYGLDDKIKFIGYKQKNEIIDYYSNSDVFLMPSYLEVWGLVLNEALASGLFCLASKYAGATFDLIEDGENGLIVDPKDVNDLVAKIEKTFDLEFNKNTIKDSFRVSYEEEARKILEAVKKAER
jgi:glycosyltransferase involved in cell wall biosynthesis